MLRHLNCRQRRDEGADLLGIARSCSGEIIRSLARTMYQNGLVFHAAMLVLSAKAFAKIGP